MLPILDLISATIFRIFDTNLKRPWTFGFTAMLNQFNGNQQLKKSKFRMNTFRRSHAVVAIVYVEKGKVTTGL